VPGALATPSILLLKLLARTALGTVLQEGPQTAAPTEPNTAEQATIIAVTMVAHSSMVRLVSTFRSTPIHLSALRLATVTLASPLAKSLKELTERFESELDWTWLLWCSCSDIGQTVSPEIGFPRRPHPGSSVNRGKRMGHSTKLRPVLGRATSCACAALERFQTCDQVPRRRGGVVGVI